MLVNGLPCRTIRIAEEATIEVIDQRLLPHRLHWHRITDLDGAVEAIRAMIVRGAPLIGVTAAYALYLASSKLDDRLSIDEQLHSAAIRLKQARPTAVNLAWAVDRQLQSVAGMSDPKSITQTLLDGANAIALEDIERCRMIGMHGLPLVEEISRRKGGAPVNILTHCNAGWLACVDYGTATAPVYMAHDNGTAVHIWVDETRPRNQGARLTAWELAGHGVPHTVIADNAGGHLMQHGMVDMVIVGSDRTTRRGDVCNKIGTYLKALAAYDNGIPFYVALPSSTIDWTMSDGLREIPIEERDPDEVRSISGDLDGLEREVLLMPASSPVSNPGFDVTPARLVTALLTERGICEASGSGIARLFPERESTDDR
jgi:methylthioribose-1-phosphate isomerase